MPWVQRVRHLEWMKKGGTVDLDEKRWPNFHRLSRTCSMGKTFIDYHYTFQHVLHLSWLFGPALKKWNFTLTFLLSAITSAFASLKTFSLSAWSRSLAKFARWSCSFKSLTSRWWRDLIVISSVFASAACKKRTSERRINLFFYRHNGNNKKELQSNEMTYQHVRTHLTTRHITRQVTSCHVTQCHTLSHN